MAMGRRKRSVQGPYFRMLIIGYFEGMDSERGIAWRIPIRLRLREFLGLELQQRPPDSFQRLADAAPRPTVVERQEIVQVSSEYNRFP